MEVDIVVGDLGTAQPIDRKARAGGAGIVARVHRRGRTDHPEEVPAAIGDRTVTGLGAGLHQRVVGGDVCRHGIVRARGDEQQPELRAVGEAGRLQRPVRGHRVGAVGIGRGALARRLCRRPAGQAGEERQGEQRGGKDGAQPADGRTRARGTAGDGRI